jgi:negative regulator of sigma E activity
MINYAKLEFLHYRVFLRLENLTESKERQLIAFLENQKEIISITKTIGYCELEFRCIVINVDDFYNLMNIIRKKFPEVIKEYDSVLYHKFNKVLNYYPF